MTKICSVCHEELPLTEFYKWSLSKDGYRQQCKKCISQMNRKYYSNNSDQIKSAVKLYSIENSEKIHAYQKQYREEHKDDLKDYYKSFYGSKRKYVDAMKTPCAKCGESRAHLLDYHHIDPTQKSFTICDKFRCTKDELENEISKCVCLCANCHREFHHIYGIKPKDPANSLAEYLNID